MYKAVEVLSEKCWFFVYSIPFFMLFDLLCRANERSNTSSWRVQNKHGSLMIMCHVSSVCVIFGWFKNVDIPSNAEINKMPSPDRTVSRHDSQQKFGCCNRLRIARRSAFIPWSCCSIFVVTFKLWSTVEWSRPPKKRPMSWLLKSVISRIQ